jgi:glycosyltransferase involved in cell wall biosynthesis
MPQTVDEPMASSAAERSQHRVRNWDARASVSKLLGQLRAAPLHKTSTFSTAITQIALSLSFVFPCLNEEATLEKVVRQARASLDTLGVPSEVVVADNGSTDRSIHIAQSLGCRVVNVPVRGYGAALRAGIEAAHGEYVAFADSDGTYLYEHAAPLYLKAREHDADMAIASRLNGTIEPGAMPPLHRWLGTPVLTTLINKLFRGKLIDCNSGFRCVRKSSYQRWDIRSDGMEFASELLIKALKDHSRIVDMPSGLRRGPEGRVAHLRTWRDGMRHLLFIFSEKPALFEWLGLLLVVPATLLQILAVVTGPVALGKFHIFDIHSQVILLMAGIIGTQFYAFACSLYLSTKDRSLRLTRALIAMDEGVLFFVLLSVLVGCSGVVALLVAIWAKSGFAGLHQSNRFLAAVHLLGVTLMGAIGLLSMQTLKKAKK